MGARACMVKSLKFPILPVVLVYAVMHDQLCMMRALFDTSFTTSFTTRRVVLAHMLLLLRAQRLMS